jgi:hypothetical protein
VEPVAEKDQSPEKLKSKSDEDQKTEDETAHQQAAQSDDNFYSFDRKEEQPVEIKQEYDVPASQPEMFLLMIIIFETLNNFV